VKIVTRAEAQLFMAELPRDQESTAVASELADRIMRFVAIAGNSRIPGWVLAAQSWRPSRSDGQQPFAAPILTRPERKRAVLG
jgi:hypothetical protein